MGSIYSQYLILQRHPSISLELQNCLGGYNEEAGGLHMLPKQLHPYFMGAISSAIDPIDYSGVAKIE